MCAGLLGPVCSYHHYPSQYPHVHVLIMLSMSNEVSQAAESLVDLLRPLLRPHSEIGLSSAKDQPQGRIIGSTMALLEALKARLITVYTTKRAIRCNKVWVYIYSICIYVYILQQCFS